VSVSIPRNPPNQPPSAVGPETREPGEAEEDHQDARAVGRPPPPGLQADHAPGEADEKPDRGGQRRRVGNPAARDQRRSRTADGERRRPKNKPEELHHEQYFRSAGEARVGPHVPAPRAPDISAASPPPLMGGKRRSRAGRDVAAADPNERDQPTTRHDAGGESNGIGEDGGRLADPGGLVRPIGRLGTSPQGDASSPAAPAGQPQSLGALARLFTRCC